MEPTKTCPLCKMVNITLWNDGSRNTSCECPRCGEFAISWELASSFGIPEDLLPYVSAATRRASARGEKLFLKTTNWRELAEDQRAVSIPTKIQGLLEFIGEKARIPGGYSLIRASIDYPLFSAASPGEIAEYLSHLESKGLIREFGLQGGEGNFTPTIEGWQKLEPLSSPGGEPDRCFVAMWFHDDLDAVYETGFAKAIEQCGFKPYRVKEDPTNKSIIDKILAEIRRSHFVVADFTGQRSSVYYEAGFAHGIGREVIGCCREGDTKALAFDTRHLGHIVWKDAADLHLKLVDSIQANILPRR